MNEKIKYIIDFKVRPTVNHPSYFDFQFGTFSILLLSNSLEHASEKAIRIVRELPFEVVGKPRPRLYDRSRLFPEEIFQEDSIKFAGFATYTRFFRTGEGDEAFWETAEWEEPPTA